MRRLLTTAGHYKFEEEIYPKGFIGGKIIATNLETREQTSRVYKIYHNNKTDKWNVLGKLITELIPPEELQQKKDKKLDK